MLEPSRPSGTILVLTQRSVDSMHLPDRLMRYQRLSRQTRCMSLVTADLSSFSNALAELIQKSTQAVVAVKPAAYRVASGVIFRDNLIAVANHSLRRADPIPVQLADGTHREGTILGRHIGFDTAILQVEGQKLNLLPPCDPGQLKPGMLTAVVGLTIDVGPSASVGILGAVGRQRRTWRGGTLDYFLRLDINLYPSQTGAAVVDSAGALIGMATPSLLRHSAAAVPLATLNRIADELLNQGRIREGYLGVGVQPVPIPASLREKLGIQSDAGLIVLNVEPDSPADKANLQLGDILLSLDVHKMNDVDDLQAALKTENVGREIDAILLRGGTVLRLQLSISERIKKEK